MAIMINLRDFIVDASKNHKAIGHFNFSTMEMLRGIVSGAKEMNVPVIVGASEGERSFMGDREIRALVSAFCAEFDMPIFLNADHTKSFEKAKQAIDAGFDSVVVDASALPFVENVSVVKKVLDYVKMSGRDVIVEAELGFIGTSSEVLDVLPPGVPVDESSMTSVSEARKLIEETKADLLAPAVGNVHGVIREGGNPPLSIKRIGEIHKAVGVPLVLHGASGVLEKDVRDSIKVGVSVVHFSTDLRVAYKKAISVAFLAEPEEISPYKYLGKSVQSVKEVVKTKISWLS
jgi:fructose-bisphosphate aldolase class II